MKLQTIPELATAVRAGDRRALARAISLVESRASGARDLIKALYPHTGRAWVVGITGSPGAGKSTLVSALAQACRREGRTVGIIAVDPSSPFTGGALLGDRIRLAGDEPDPGIFFRSLASRGHLGGLSRAAGDVIHLMDAAGREVILIETVGAGQSEVEVMGFAQTTIVVTMPGTGDEVQANKAGILEIGDIFVVNKADRDGADATVAALEGMLDLGEGSLAPRDVGHHGAAAATPPAAAVTPPAAAATPPAAAATPPAAAATPKDDVRWRPPVLKTVARDGRGIPELLTALAGHRQYALASGQGEARRLARAEEWLLEIAAQTLLEQVREAARRDGRLSRLAGEVATRRLDAYTAAEALLKG